MLYIIFYIYYLIYILLHYTIVVNFDVTPDVSDCVSLELNPFTTSIIILCLRFLNTFVPTDNSIVQAAALTPYKPS